METFYAPLQSKLIYIQQMHSHHLEQSEIWNSYGSDFEYCCFLGFGAT
jgi:hypothetical protein